MSDLPIASAAPKEHERSVQSWRRRARALLNRAGRALSTRSMCPPCLRRRPRVTMQDIQDDLDYGRT